MLMPLYLVVLMLCAEACAAVGGQGGAVWERAGMLLALASAVLARLRLIDFGPSNVRTVMAWKCP